MPSEIAFNEFSSEFHSQNLLITKMYLTVKKIMVHENAFSVLIPVKVLSKAFRRSFLSIGSMLKL